MYTDPDGELIWVIPNIGFSRDGGLSFGLSVVVGLPGVWSAQAGVGYNTGYGPGEGSVYGYVGATAAMNTISASYSTSGGFSVGYSAGATVFSGLPISTNFASVGLNYNISNNSFNGNVSAWQIDQSGVRFNPSVSAMVFPEQTTNLVRGQGFNSNNTVLNNFVSEGQYQGALDYFGFGGTFDPGNEIFTRGNGQAAAAAVDPRTGEIFYNEGAYYSYAELAFTAHHEQIHSQNVLSGKYDGVEIDYMVAGKEEWSTYMQNYKELGLYPYPQGRNELISRINHYGLQAGIYEYIKTPTSFTSTAFTPSWWHIIYRIPRKW